MKLVDFDQCPVDYSAAYAGNAGKKFGVIFQGERWMLKFPESTSTFPGKPGHLPAYTSSPLSEYIGSAVYAALDIPVHSVILGKRDGKLVCGCKDFDIDRSMVSYAMAKNFLDCDDGLTSSGSSGQGEPLEDALLAIERSPILRATPGIADRFWDMFVVDALIRNNDRNNGNWGIFLHDGSNVCAPVFDNGNSFFNKRKPSVAALRIIDEALMEEDTLGTGTSFFLDVNGNHIHPFAYMAATDNVACQQAMRRIADRLAANPGRLGAILEEIPEEDLGLSVLPEAVALHYAKLLEITTTQGLLPLVSQTLS